MSIRYRVAFNPQKSTPLFNQANGYWKAEKEKAEKVEKHLAEIMLEYDLDKDSPITLCFRGNLFWVSMYGQRLGKLLIFENLDKNGK